MKAFAPALLAASILASACGSADFGGVAHTAAQPAGGAKPAVVAKDAQAGTANPQAGAPNAARDQAVAVSTTTQAPVTTQAGGANANDNAPAAALPATGGDANENGPTTTLPASGGDANENGPTTTLPATGGNGATEESPTTTQPVTTAPPTTTPPPPACPTAADLTVARTLTTANLDTMKHTLDLHTFLYDDGIIDFFPRVDTVAELKAWSAGAITRQGGGDFDFKDAWCRELGGFSADPATHTLRFASAGPDGVFGTADDITAIWHGDDI